jgi:hypothetical protein
MPIALERETLACPFASSLLIFDPLPCSGVFFRGRFEPDAAVWRMDVPVPDTPAAQSGLGCGLRILSFAREPDLARIAHQRDFRLRGNAGYI